MIALAERMLCLTIIGLASAADTVEDIPNLRFAGIGVFFIVIGNYTGKVTRNSYVGIRAR